MFDSLASLLCVERKHKCDKLEVLQEAIRVIEVRESRVTDAFECEFRLVINSSWLCVVAGTEEQQ